MNEPNSTISNLRKSANARFDSTTAGTGILTSIIGLSAILSAVFFWRHSSTVFAGMPVILATVLGLAIGLIPSEGAFFGWKRIRATKKDMTAAQIKASAVGLWAAVAFAVANVIAIFVSSFPEIPLQVQALTSWIVFLALMLPIPTQFILFAQFVVNEQTVVENRLAARLSALAHAAYIHGEEARMEAAIQGMERELESSLPAYGATVGAENANRALADGRRDIVGQFYGPRAVPSDRPQLPASLTDDDLARIVAAVAAMSNSTHDPQVYPLAQPGQGEGNGAPPARYGGEARP